MISRDLYIDKIRPFMDKDIVKVMTGIRRCGKSVMLQLIQEELLRQGKSREDMLSINFESKLLPFVKSAEGAFHYIKDFAVSRNHSKIYLFLDEIQDLPGWEEMVNALLIDFDVDIYLTGSNAKMLSGELATYLGGRYIEVKIYPFSFSEVLQIYQENGNQINEEEAFLHYITYGGMPFLYQYNIEEQPAREYLQDVFNSIILKDITQRNQIREVALFIRLTMYFVSGIGNAYSASGIQKYLKSEGRNISTETVYNYIDYCKQACLLHLVSREELIGKRILQFQEKIYLTDHGFREAFYGNNMRDIGQVLENIVYMELLRRGYEITIGKNGNWEVDFSAKRGNQKLYVQVAYLLATEETVEREFRSLETIPDNYPKYVVTMDMVDRSRNGIKHVNIRKFLQMESFE